jgi:hypothetical protein
MDIIGHKHLDFFFFFLLFVNCCHYGMLDSLCQDRASYIGVARADWAMESGYSDLFGLAESMLSRKRTLTFYCRAPAMVKTSLSGVVGNNCCECRIPINIIAGIRRLKLLY